jgi:STAS-like domain of unknown function (DUF4325)
MEIKDLIVINKDFTDTPGARFRSEGKFSGQQFLEDLLLPKFEAAVEGNYILQVDLDNVWGFPSSFVSGSFGELSVRRGKNLVMKHISFITTNDTKKNKFIEEIQNPQKNER